MVTELVSVSAAVLEQADGFGQVGGVVDHQRAALQTGYGRVDDIAIVLSGRRVEWRGNAAAAASATASG